MCRPVPRLPSLVWSVHHSNSLVPFRELAQTSYRRSLSTPSFPVTLACHRTQGENDPDTTPYPGHTDQRAETVPLLFGGILVLSGTRPRLRGVEALPYVNQSSIRDRSLSVSISISVFFPCVSCCSLCTFTLPLHLMASALTYDMCVCVLVARASHVCVLCHVMMNGSNPSTPGVFCR